MPVLRRTIRLRHCTEVDIQFPTHGRALFLLVDRRAETVALACTPGGSPRLSSMPSSRKVANKILIAVVALPCSWRRSKVREVPNISAGSAKRMSSLTRVVRTAAPSSSEFLIFKVLSNNGVISSTHWHHNPQPLRNRPPLHRVAYCATIRLSFGPAAAYWQRHPCCDRAGQCR